MNHKKKIKLARKMQTPLEKKIGVSKFDSKEWRKRVSARLLKETNKRKHK